jgi:hypothetical protein
MANTTNFNWETPDDTDLVKDGAAAIRTLGSAIDTSLVDLKGGTTDQVLAKNSNTDMDFKWVADASGIPATIFDAKGDLIVASAADTAARLPVGTNGYTLVANSATSTGLEWAAPAAGGGFTQLATASFSGTTIDLTSISGSYKNLVLVFQGITSTGGADINLRFNGDSGNNYGWSQFWTGMSGFNTGNPVSYHGTTQPFVSGTSNVSLYCMLPNYANTAGEKLIISYISGTINGSINAVHCFGTYKSTSAINRIQTTASITGGSYFLYGEN